MTKDVYKLAREKVLELARPSCEFAEEVRENGGYTMNCHYFGCMHLQDGSCPVLKGAP